MRIIKWLAASSLLILLWGGVLVFGALDGWFREPMAPEGDAEKFMEAAVEYLQKDEPANIAFVLLEKGEVYGRYYSNGINDNTLFPLASMSKWFTAHAVMSLVETGDLELDAPVASYLSRWQFPETEFDNNRITTRLLLSHTSGLGDGLGFGDYTADETLPSIEESLSNPRASSDREVEIGLTKVPGSEWDYSGGGYLVLELLIEEVSGMTFEAYMRNEIFDPLDMRRSTYEYLGDFDNTAASLDVNAKPVPFYKYAAASATGLSSSAHELTLFLQAQISPSTLLLPMERLEEMRGPQASILGLPVWGLGTMLYAETDSGGFIVGHGGQNEPAINTEARLNPENGDGIILLVSGNPSLATRLGFEWTFWQTGRPDFIGSGGEVEKVIPWFAYGALFLLLIAAIGYWRTQK